MFLRLVLVKAWGQPGKGANRMKSKKNVITYVQYNYNRWC